jgi:hypothetical protein
MRRDLPMSKEVLRISFSLGGAYFALGGILFSSVGIFSYFVNLGFHLTPRVCTLVFNGKPSF